jgi:hypothetical protein
MLHDEHARHTGVENEGNVPGREAENPIACEASGKTEDTYFADTRRKRAFDAKTMGCTVVSVNAGSHGVVGAAGRC